MNFWILKAALGQTSGTRGWRWKCQLIGSVILREFAMQIDAAMRMCQWELTTGPGPGQGLDTKILWPFQKARGTKMLSKRKTINHMSPSSTTWWEKGTTWDRKLKRSLSCVVSIDSGKWQGPCLQPFRLTDKLWQPVRPTDKSLWTLHFTVLYRANYRDTRFCDMRMW